MDRLRDLTISPVQRVLAGAGVILVVVAVLLGLQYRAASAHRHELNQQLSALQATIVRLNLSGDAEDPNGPTTFPPNPPNLELASLILASAASSGVETSPLQAAAQGTDAFGANSYRTITLNLTISGTLPQVLDFFDRVERGNIKTLTFDNLHLEPTAGQWTAQVQVIAYAQPE